MIRRFFCNTRGSIPIMAAFMFVPLLVVSGAGIDFMRHEMMRSKLQDSLDRGVLAAASLNQTIGPEATIRGYLRSADLPSDIQLEVSEERSLNRRRITADASLSVPVSLLGLAGVKDLTASARSIAEESRANVELSLILDISGSMVDKGVFGTMKTAAQQFVETVLRPDMVNVTSLNVIPFAGDVNIGPTIFDYLATMARPSVLANQQYTAQKVKPAAPKDSIYIRKHTSSSCFQLQKRDFGLTFPFFPDIEQTAHFSYYNYNSSGAKGKWWCPADDARIVVMGNDMSAIKSRIGGMQSYDGTGTHIAMKWAMLLLDPVVRPYVAFATTQNSDIKISSGFKSRPANFDDKGTGKFIVLMTDGETSFQERPKNSQPGSYTTEAARTNSGGGTAQNWDVPWGKNWDAAASEAEMMSLCTQAKSKGVTVFTIGFKITGGNANKFYQQLEKCASSPSHFYRVEDTNIAAAFQSIASAIQRIRLVRDGASS